MTELQPWSPLQIWGDPGIINQNHLRLLSFGKMWDTGGEGTGDNPARLNEFFQIIHDCETENVHNRQNFS